MSTDLAPSLPPDDTSSVDLNPAVTRQNDVDFQNPEKPEPKPEKAMTARQAIERAAADLKVADKEPEEQAKPEPKPEAEKPEPDTKPAPEQQTPPAKPDGVERAASEPDKPKPSEGKGIEAPARFLPRAKETWQNTPNPVKEEVHRLLQETEHEVSQAREAVENWKQIEPFHRQAVAAGTTVPQWIERVRAIEVLLQRNPEEGIKRVLAEAQITPEQYARHILHQEQQRAQNPALAQTDQLGRTIQQLQQQIQQMQQQDQQRQERARIEQMAQRIIEPFRAENPRYDELEPTIAQILNSGMIPSTLSERQKLETAYDMAVRLNPSSSPQPSIGAAAPAPEATRVNPAGEKSIKGSPTPGTDLSAGARGKKLNRRDSIRAAAAELGIDL